MKTIMKGAVLAVSLAVSLSAIAQEEEAPCLGVEGMARIMMEARQSGVPLRELLRIAKIMTNPKLNVEIAKSAYAYPLYADKAFAQLATNEFANVWYLECLKSRDESQ